MTGNVQHIDVCGLAVSFAMHSLRPNYKSKNDQHGPCQLRSQSSGKLRAINGVTKDNNTEDLRQLV